MIMKLNWKISGVVFLIAAAGWVNAQVYTGTKVGKYGGLNGYHLSMGNYFNVSEKEILRCGRRHVLEEELPVVFFLAQKAGKSSGTIVNLHDRGMSWMRMAQHFNLGPRIFYVSAGGEVKKSPYQKIYEYYLGNRSRIQLSDADVVNMVNLKFISDHYGHDPQEIILMRNKGKTFPDIDDTFRQEKEDMSWDAKDALLDVRNSKGELDPRKGDKNSLDPIEKKQNR
jgi:hypothetical protein